WVAREREEQELDVSYLRVTILLLPLHGHEAVLRLLGRKTLCTVRRFCLSRCPPLELCPHFTVVPPSPDQGPPQALQADYVLHRGQHLKVQQTSKMSKCLRSLVGEVTFSALQGTPHLYKATVERMTKAAKSARGALLLGLHSMTPLSLANAPREEDTADPTRSAVEDGPLVQSLFLATLFDVLDNLKDSEGPNQIRLGVVDLCHKHDEETGDQPDQAEELHDWCWRDATTLDSHAVQRGGAGGRLKNMLRLASFGVRPFQVGMKRQVVWNVEEAVEVLSTCAPFALESTVARFLIAEVDQMDGPGEVTCQMHSSTAFVPAEVKTCMVVGGMFSSAERLTEYLRTTRTDIPSEAEVALGEPQEQKRGTPSGWPCDPTPEGLAKFCNRLAEQGVVLEMEQPAGAEKTVSINSGQAHGEGLNIMPTQGTWDLLKELDKTIEIRRTCFKPQVDHRQCWLPTLAGSTDTLLGSIL
ncbi:hypothetical protein CYMTET_13476, partial [Cymbomonas tetramitiformis]